MSLFLVAVLALTGVTGCANAKTGGGESGSAAETESSMETVSAAAAIMLTDQAGREVTLPAPAKRLVSSYYRCV